MKLMRNVRKIMMSALIIISSITMLPIGNLVFAGNYVVNNNSGTKNANTNNNGGNGSGSLVIKNTIIVDTYKYNKNSGTVTKKGSDSNTSKSVTDNKSNSNTSINNAENNELGKSNSEINYFASWLKVKRSNVQYIQENNLVAKDEVVTYYVEYYNGKSEKVQNTKFVLSIPENVGLIEASNNGKLVSNNGTSNVEWNIDNIEASATGKLSAKVKFLTDSELEKSQNLSKEIYTKLETIESNNKTNSYVRQLFIDKNTSKTASFSKYLDIFDSTNSIRPDDEITRAEFAKIISDSGIIEVTSNSKEYLKFNDSDQIPTYARNAISSLTKAGIMTVYSDGTVKPNNPILKDELIQMIAKLSAYVSEEKLAVQKAVFIDTSVINDNNTKNQNYIMELLRENIISKDYAKGDLNQYVKRSEVANIINTLTFRGPFVNSIKTNTLKFTEIMNQKYFYYLMGASNNYEYNYTDKLWQNIVNVK